MHTIIKCNICGFYFLDEATEEDQKSHTQDHLVLNHEAPGYTQIVVDDEEYWDYFEGGKENYMQFQSEIGVGYMPKGTSYSQWWIHTEMLGDDEEATPVEDRRSKTIKWMEENHIPSTFYGGETIKLDASNVIVPEDDES